MQLDQLTTKSSYNMCETKFCQKWHRSKTPSNGKMKNILTKVQGVFVLFLWFCINCNYKNWKMRKTHQETLLLSFKY